MDKRFHTGMILLDLQKAHGTLDHIVLLQKMECTGFKESVIKSFLISQRECFCDTRKCVFSDAGLINCYVPQGSILGPLFFLKYINDLPQALNKTRSYLYADDTCIFYQDKDVENIEKVLNKKFSSLCEWFIDNKLPIHFGDDKTKTIFFSQMKSPPKLNISFGDNSLKQRNTIEYLGCYLDSNLNGESMACRVLKKINTKLNFLWRQSNYLNYSSRRLLCNALIQPHFDYGCTSWYPLISKALKT